MENFKSNNNFSFHFTYNKLIKFVFPTVLMVIFTSLYTIVDGFFVSNYVGKVQFAAVNLVFPFLMFLGSFGFMLGAGGSAVVAKTLGEKDSNLANRYFSNVVYFAIILSLIFSFSGWFFFKPLLLKFGAQGELFEYSLIYGRIIIFSLIPFTLQNLFQYLFITAGKPELGFKITFLAGCVNMILDYIFVARLNFGLQGAAFATIISQIIGGAVPLIYFINKNSSFLRLVKTKPYFKILLKSIVNGYSEMLAVVSASLINTLYIWQLYHFLGDDGVASYGIIMYIEFIFSGLFLGYSTGVSPVISYNFGAQNHIELKSLFKKSILIITFLSFFVVLFSQAFAFKLTGIFANYDDNLHKIASDGFKIYALAFLLMGFNIFASAFYTALNNGVVSGIISFLRTFIFQVLFIFLLPKFFGITGLWLAIALGEICTVVVVLMFLIKTKNKYKFL